MPSDNRDIQSAIQAGESERVEFKKIFDKEAIETLVAFANHKGGMLLVGVEDSGRVAGVLCGPEPWSLHMRRAATASSYP